MVGEQRKEGEKTLVNHKPSEANPFLCAQNLLRKSSITEAPVSEEALVEYLGYRIEMFSADGYPNKDEIHKELATACAFVNKEERHIKVYEDISESRKRWSIFHEIGHIILPWHSETLYRCFPEDLHAWCKNQIEKEANECAGELIMPRDMFVPDIARLPIAIDSIRVLKDKYKASLEAAAIRYAATHSRRCATLMVILKDGFLQTKYFVASKRLKYFIRTGIEIPSGNILHKAFHNQVPMKGKVSSSIFGSSECFQYSADCFPLRRYEDNMLVLLWLPDNQTSFGF